MYKRGDVSCADNRPELWPPRASGLRAFIALSMAKPSRRVAETTWNSAARRCVSAPKRKSIDEEASIVRSPKEAIYPAIIIF